jgi:hypothetical protein
VPFALEPIFGRRLIVLWAIGSVLRLASTLCVYLWLSRWVKPWAAAAAGVTAFVVASGDVADFPAFYNHVGVSYGVIGTYLAWLATDARGGRSTLLGSLAGLVLALGFLTKQTTGILIPAAVVPPLMLAVWFRRGFGGAVALAGSLLLGASLPLILAYGWLLDNGLVEAYFGQVYLKAPSSKGGLGTTLLRPVVSPFSSGLFGRVPVLGVAVAAILAVLSLARRRPYAGPKPRVAPELLVSVPILAAILIGRIPSAGRWIAERDPLLVASYVAMAGSLAIGLVVLGRVVRERGSSGESLALLVLSALGFSCAYALSISWAIFEVMAFPGLVLLLALPLSALDQGQARKVARVALFAMCVALVAIGSYRKHFLPFAWGWAEPPLSASTETSVLPELKGFVLSPSTVAAFEGVTALIKKYSSPDERIWVYPAMPIFYGLANRRPAPFAPHQAMDTCPDDIAEADARLVLADPPAVIVAQLRSPRGHRFLEGVFRGGQPSGLRKLDDALAQLLPRYQLVGRFDSKAVIATSPISVFALRRDLPPAPPAPRSP